MQTIKRLVRLMLEKRYRRWLAIGIVVASAAFVLHFFSANPQYLTRLSHVSPLVVLLVIVLNIPAMLALAWAYSIMLRLCGKPIDTKENLLLTAYSSIINFFGPLQSGPGVRAVYLKTRHGVRMRDYLFVTLIYYAFFATLSALLLLVGTTPWWQTLLGLLGAAGCSAVVLKWFAGKQTKKNEPHVGVHLEPTLLVTLAAAVTMQLLCIAGYYYVELRAVNPHIGLGQAISYAGAANFSLFVSITPDAVGIREAFLVFSQHIHHISTADIINANIIDRGSYLLYLGLLFLVTLAVHARERLRLRAK